MESSELTKQTHPYLPFLFWTHFAFTSPHVLVVAAEHLQHGCTLSLRLGSDCDPTLLRLLQRSYGCDHQCSSH